MILLAAAAWVTVAFAQVAPPVPVPQSEPPGAPAPAPGGNARVTAQTQEVSDDRLVHIAETMAGGLATQGVHNMEGLTNKAFDMPSGLFDRSRDNTINEEHARQQANGMLVLIPGLTVLGMGMAAALAIFGAFTGGEFGPLASLRGMATVGFGTGVAVNNSRVLGAIVDGVGLVLKTVAITPIRTLAAPGIGLDATVSPFIGGVADVAYCLVVLVLIVIFSIELGWVWVLSGLAPLWLMAKYMPILDGVGTYFGSRWFGSLLSPMMALAALNMGSVMIGTSGGVVSVGDQFKRIIFMIIAYQSPGFMVGAVAVKLPSIANAYLAGRLIGLGRYTPRGSSGGGGGALPPPPSSPPPPVPRPAPVGGRAHGSGGGTAATGRATWGP